MYNMESVVFGDFFSILAILEMNQSNDYPVQNIALSTL